MNLRIKELIEEATFDDHMCSATPRYYFDKKLFAKLIVKECANFILEYPEKYLTYNQALEISLGMEEHFGIEEQKGWVCNKCGVDRTKEECPKGHVAALTGECPMVGVAQ